MLQTIRTSHEGIDRCTQPVVVWMRDALGDAARTFWALRAPVHNGRLEALADAWPNTRVGL